jgi:hypothetical protein
MTATTKISSISVKPFWFFEFPSAIIRLLFS